MNLDAPRVTTRPGGSDATRRRNGGSTGGGGEVQPEAEEEQDDNNNDDDDDEDDKSDPEGEARHMEETMDGVRHARAADKAAKRASAGVITLASEEEAACVHTDTNPSTKIAGTTSLSSNSLIRRRGRNTVIFSLKSPVKVLFSTLFTQ
jgi:hypothetical protein